VQPGTYLEAFALAARANERHGVRLTAEDRQKRVDAALSMPENHGKSVNAIAMLCNAHERDVNARLDALTKSGQVPQWGTSANGKVRGRDGKLYPAARPAPPREPVAVDAGPAGCAAESNACMYITSMSDNGYYVALMRRERNLREMRNAAAHLVRSCGLACATRSAEP
jgi:hypothetical protein